MQHVVVAVVHHSENHDLMHSVCLGIWNPVSCNVWAWDICKTTIYSLGKLNWREEELKRIQESRNRLPTIRLKWSLDWRVTKLQLAIAIVGKTYKAYSTMFKTSICLTSLPLRLSLWAINLISHFLYFFFYFTHFYTRFLRSFFPFFALACDKRDYYGTRRHCWQTIKIKRSDGW